LSLLLCASVLNVADVFTTRKALEDPDVEEANGLVSSLASRLGLSITVAGSIMKVPLEVVIVFLYYLSSRPGAPLAFDLLEIITLVLLAIVVFNLSTIWRGERP
jgi:hypothetical protein